MNGIEFARIMPTMRRYGVLEALTRPRHSPEDRKRNQTPRQVMRTEHRARPLFVLVFLCVVSAALPLNGQAPEPPNDTSDQLWLNLILARPVSQKLYVEIDIEHAREVSGEDRFRYIYGTGMVEYYAKPWLDLTGELVTGRNRLTSEEESIEASVRLGTRFHLGNNVFWAWLPEKSRPEILPDRRYNFGVLLRYEHRNFWYSTDRPSTADARFRGRLEFKFALNKPNMGTDGVWYLMTDLEGFVPLVDDEAAELFATKARARFGFGYRWNYEWRFEILAQRDEARETLEDEIDVEAYMIDLRVKWFF